MTSDKKKELALFAADVRKGILTSTHAAKSGHPGGSLSSAEYFTYLYKAEMKINPNNPKWEERDRYKADAESRPARGGWIEI